MKILVTGGAGFIGSNFVRHLLSKNESKISHIRILDDLTYSGSVENLRGIDEDSIEFIKGNICEEDTVDKALRGIDVVVHFAAESHVDRSINSSKVFFQSNVMGTQNILDSSLKFDLDTFVHVSTDEVYGSILEGSWTEEANLSPNSPYAASKAGSDLTALCFARTHGLDVRVSRCSNNYGPYQFPEKAIPLFITNLIQGIKIPLYGNGKNVRDWLHVLDHCEGLYLVLTKGRPGEVYNIGGGYELSNYDLAKLIIEEMGADSDLIEYVTDRKGHDFRYSLDHTKAEVELGHQPRITFLDGIRSTINWYREHESWWRPRRKS